MESNFVYNTLTGQFYISLKNERIDRCLYQDKKGIFYKKQGIKYLNELETERFNSFMEKATN